VVFEILSDSTAREDVFVKNAEYRATPSIQRYIILEQTQPAAVVFARKGDDWISEVVTDEGLLHMPEIGIEVPLAELCADIDLSVQDGDGRET
jgi:Uma2 family endonuclease